MIDQKKIHGALTAELEGKDTKVADKLLEDFSKRLADSLAKLRERGLVGELSNVVVIYDGKSKAHVPVRMVLA